MILVMPIWRCLVRMPLRDRDAGVALFDKIGPAVLFTHSQSGAVR
jgi:hypothetical protein